jgi:hypothetical protein
MAATMQRMQGDVPSVDAVLCSTSSCMGEAHICTAPSAGQHQEAAGGAEATQVVAGGRHVLTQLIAGQPRYRGPAEVAAQEAAICGAVLCMCDQLSSTGACSEHQMLRTAFTPQETCRCSGLGSSVACSIVAMAAGHVVMLCACRVAGCAVYSNTLQIAVKDFVSAEQHVCNRHIFAVNGSGSALLANITSCRL